MVNLHEAYQSFTNLPELSDYEKRNPFSKFYYVPVELPSEEILKAIEVGTHMNPSKALAITDMARLVEPGYHEVENGYCIMPDGTGYSAVKINLPNVSMPEFTYFMEYGHENNIQYKTWLPKLHLQQGQFTIENLGWGPLLFHQKLAVMINEKTLGLTEPQTIDSDFISLTGGSMYTIDALSGKRSDITMMNYIRHSGKGIELRVRVWYGLHLIHGKSVRKIAEGEIFPIDRVCATATHNAFEWTRANTIAHDVFVMKGSMEATFPKSLSNRMV